MPNNNSPNKMKLKIQPVNAVILVFVLAVVVALGYISIFNKSSNSQDTANSVEHKNILFSSDIEEQIKKDKDALDSMINFINTYKPNDVNSVVGLVEEVYGFRTLIEAVNFLSKKYSSDTSFTNKTSKMLDIMRQRQNHYFPIFRGSYSKIANRLMNTDGITSFVSGPNNNTLEFVGDRYLDSVNVKVDFDILLSHLELLRYKQVVFRSKEKNAIVKTYNINSASDDAMY